MTDKTSLHRDRGRPHRGVAALLPTTLWLGMTILSVALTESQSHAAVLAVAGSLGLATSLAFMFWNEQTRWVTPLRKLSEHIDALAQDPTGDVRIDAPPLWWPLAHSVDALAGALRRAQEANLSTTIFTPPGESGTTGPRGALTRSGLYNGGSKIFDVPFDANASGEFSTTDMVNRLEPRLFRWKESSAAEQQFLGWNLDQLREKSFLEIVHPDDLERVQEGLRAALVKGEVHGLILRIRTSFGRSRAIEMNVGARYGSDLNVSHLRCHITDVTAKVKAERETRLRTRELTQVNDQLRLINRELEELKERYRDLYQNAPAMYFSLDITGRFLECNETLLRTLGYRADELIGRHYETILPASRRSKFAVNFAEFLRKGSVEVSSRWVKANGETIDVWVNGTAVLGDNGEFLRSRIVAQDVTARHRLEAELQEKNERLAATIEELSRRNREMDEFTYVVSHDLQEPIRTLNAFSDFLLRDYGSTLDDDGKEFVRHIVDASKRMRALIRDLLNLSRIGKITSEFRAVDLDVLIGVVRADLGELIRSSRATVRVHGPLPEVWGDRSRLGQLLTNLISNAIKYNDKPAPMVEVGVIATGPGTRSPGTAEPMSDGNSGSTEDFADWVTLFVKDNGIGIEPQFHKKIFQLFRRLHTREEYEGNGAGLAICEKVAHAHGGDIWVDSDPGRGSTFFVSLPRPPVTAARS